MSFLTLNGTAIRCRRDACDVKHAEHRADRARAFDGTVRITRSGVFREFTVVTGLLDESDYAAYKALIETDNPPLTAAGDWIGATSINVYPVPGSWTPLVTRAETDGFRRQAKFTMLESPTISAPDTSAEPWAFYRRGVGFWLERAASTVAADGDKVDRWDDQSGNSRHFLSHDGNGAGPDGTAWAGSLDYRPLRDTAQNGIKLGFSDNVEGWSEMRPPRTDAFNEMEVFYGVRAYADPDSVDLTLSKMREAVGGDQYPDTSGHLQISFGLPGAHDAGDPIVDLAGWNCLHLSGSNDTEELIVRLNGAELLRYPRGGSEVFLFDQNSTFVTPIGPTFFKGFKGWARDIVIFDGLTTDDQRLAWTNYIRGLTSTPPL